MASLIYSVIASLDGYVADRDGRFDWAVPDEEVLEHINDQEAGIGTYLYGRTIYELMTGWENDPAVAAQSPRSADFARVWQAADKVVYSRSLPEVSTRRTRLERTFDPTAVQQLKQVTDADLTVAGPTLATHAFRAGLVDQVLVMVVPVTVGGGLAAMPTDVRVDLRLTGQRRFGNGMVQLAYSVRTPV